MTWGLVAVAGSTLVGGLISSSASKSAANTQVAGANQATDLQKNIFDTTQTNLAPFIGAGQNTLPALLKLLGYNPGSAATPGTPAFTGLGDIDPSKLSADQLGGVNSYFTDYVRNQLKDKYAGNPNLLVPGAVGGGAPGADGKVAYDPNNINVDISKQGWDLGTLQSQYPGFDVSKVLNLAGGGGTPGTPAVAPSFDPTSSPLLKAMTPFSPTSPFAPPPPASPTTLNAGAVGPNYVPTNIGSLTVPQFQPYAPFSVPGITDSSNFQQSPGYQFALDQGLNAITNRSAKAGGAMGGNTLKAIGDFTTGLASQDFNNWFSQKLGSYDSNYGNALNAYTANTNTLLKGFGESTTANLATQAQNFEQGLTSQQQNFGQGLQTFQTNTGLDQYQRGSIYDMLSGIIGNGQSAAAGMGQIGANTGANLAGTITGGANAAAAGRVGSANAISGGVNNLAQMYYLNQLFGNKRTTPGGGNVYSPIWT